MDLYPDWKIDQASPIWHIPHSNHAFSVKYAVFTVKFEYSTHFAMIFINCHRLLTFVFASCELFRGPSPWKCQLFLDSERCQVCLGRTLGFSWDNSNLFFTCSGRSWTLDHRKTSHAPIIPEPEWPLAFNGPLYAPSALWYPNMSGRPNKLIVFIKVFNRRLVVLINFCGFWYDTPVLSFKWSV